MKNILDRGLRKVVKRILLDELSSFVVELDPNKSYIVILPDDMPQEDVQAAFKPLMGQLNLVVLMSSDTKIRIVEMS